LSSHPQHHDFFSRAALAIWLLLVLALGADMVLEPSRAPEAAVRRYLAELEAGHVEAALSALTPDAVARWRDFVLFQRLNHYEVVSVAVRSTSLLDALTGQRPWQPDQATLVVDVTEPSGVQWRGSTLIPLRRDEGRWRLARPPFAAD
jgi:hypothetical protein